MPSTLGQSRAHRIAPALFAPAVFALLSLAAFGAAAQSMKPGLWEFTNQMQSGNGEMEKAMAQLKQRMDSLPPAQRKQMEEVMAKNGTTLGAKGTVTKACMTKEMIDRNEVMGARQQGNCKSGTPSKSGNVMKVSFVCTDPQMTGESQVTFNGPESYTMKMVMDSMHEGKPQHMTMDSTAKWLATDCGAIKPIQMPAAK